MVSTLAHVTLTTGHVRQSPRSEVASHVLPMLQDWLRDALAGQVVPMQTPSRARYTMTASASADALTYELAREGVRIVTGGVARVDGVESAATWRVLHDDPPAPLATDPLHPPAAPWCAARIESGVMRSADAVSDLYWLADLERCLAWAWLGA
jgi:hypothetical protein